MKLYISYQRPIEIQIPLNPVTLQENIECESKRGNIRSERGKMEVLAEKKGIRRCEFEEKLESAREFGDEKETIGIKF